MEPLANARGSEGASLAHRGSLHIGPALNRDRQGAVQFGPASPDRERAVDIGPPPDRDREAVPSQSLLFNWRDEGAVELS
jgi:hypothetical protein